MNIRHAFSTEKPADSPFNRSRLWPLSRTREDLWNEAVRQAPATNPWIPPHPVGLQVRTILVPLDFTDRSRRLLEMAASLARRFSADLVLLHIYERYEYASACISPDHFRRTNDRVRRIALETLKKFQASFAADDLIRAAEVRVASGYLETAVADTAKAVGADLIAITSHNRSGFRRLFLGSRAELIARHAGCPVLIVPVRS